MGETNPVTVTFGRISEFHHLKQPLNMLINQDEIAIRIDYDKASRASGGLIGFIFNGQTLRFKLALQFAHVGERV